jgi:hypothetical protein
MFPMLNTKNNLMEAKMNSDSRLNVLALYDAFPAGMRAQEIYLKLLAAMEPDEVNYQILNFQVLQFPDVNDRAAEHAVVTDVLIISVQDGRSLDENARSWLKQWVRVNQTRQYPGALIALFNDPDERSENFMGFLEELADQSGLELMSRNPIQLLEVA